MKPRFLLNASLLLFLLASACTPAAPTEAEATQAVIVQPAIVIEATGTLAAPSAGDPASSTAPAVVVVVEPIATSRGPDLHATDPSTVSLTSGQLQLVEFFRFT